MPKSSKKSHAVLADDLLHGADEIGRFLGLNVRRTFYVLERGAVPAFKLQGRWCARKSALLAHIEKLEKAVAE